jgi:hypothetical protein
VKKLKELIESTSSDSDEKSDVKRKKKKKRNKRHHSISSENELKIHRKRKGLIRGVSSLQGDNKVLFNYLSASEI